jgi:hypothetical protein
MHQLQPSYLARRCALHVSSKVVKKLIIREFNLLRTQLSLENVSSSSKERVSSVNIVLKLQEFHNPFFRRDVSCIIQYTTYDPSHSNSSSNVKNARKEKYLVVLFFYWYHCNSKTVQGTRKRLDVLI